MKKKAEFLFLLVVIQFLAACNKAFFAERAEFCNVYLNFENKQQQITFFLMYQTTWYNQIGAFRERFKSNGIRLIVDWISKHEEIPLGKRLLIIHRVNHSAFKHRYLVCTSSNTTRDYHSKQSRDVWWGVLNEDDDYDNDARRWDGVCRGV